MRHPRCGSINASERGNVATSRRSSSPIVQSRGRSQLALMPRFSPDDGTRCDTTHERRVASPARAAIGERNATCDPAGTPRVRGRVRSQAVSRVVLVVLGLFVGRSIVVPQEPEPSCCRSTEQVLAGPLPTDRKSVLLRDALARLVNSTAPFLGEQRLPRLDRQIDGFPPGIDPKLLREGLSVRGNERLEVGRIDEALVDLQRALEIAQKLDDPRVLRQTYSDLGLAWMRRGERNNCVTRHNADSCLCPLRDGAIHVDKTPSREAIKCFLAALKIQPRDANAMWLLNLAHMTVGTWPDRVPESW